MKKLINNIKWLGMVVLLFTIQACDEDSDNDITEGQGELFVGFTQLIDESTGTVSFINISENAVSYSWDFGNGTSSTVINPEVVFESGTYTVTLTATDAAGGTDSFQDSFTLLVPIIASLPISFDADNTIYNVATFNGTSFEIVANPSLTGSNTSASNVGAITNGGFAFEGIKITLGSQIDLDAESTYSMEFWSDVAFDVLMKLEEGAAFTEISASHTGSGWETLEFTPAGSGQYTDLVLFADGPGTTTGTFYVDNIRAGGNPIVLEPTTAATTPTRNEANVISLFSDAYTDVTVDTYRTDWSSADFEEVMIDGNATLKYSNLDFVGIETVASQQDISSMTHIHFDVWSPDVTQLTIRLVDFGADGAFDGGDDASADVVDSAPTRGAWVSYDISLSEFTTLVTDDNMAQYLFVAQPTGNATIFVDNIYFYSE